MAATFAPVTEGQHGKQARSIGDLYLVVGNVTFSGSYATGGDALDLRDFFSGKGAGIVHAVVVADHKAGYSFEYDYTNRKLIVRQGDNDNTGDGPEVQLPAAAYPAALTTGTLRVLAYGT